MGPAFQSERLILNTETMCRLSVALEMGGVGADVRAALLARMLKTPLPGRGERDHTLDEHGPAIGYRADDDPVRQIAAAALGRHPEWVDASAERNPGVA